MEDSARGNSYFDNVLETLTVDLDRFRPSKKLPQALWRSLPGSERDKFESYYRILTAWDLFGEKAETVDISKKFQQFCARNFREREHLEIILKFYDLPSPVTGFPYGLTCHLQSLPVDPRGVQDGDSLSVHVRAPSDVPEHILRLSERAKNAYSSKNFYKAKQLQDKLSEANYQVIKINNESSLVTKYRIRLRGIDAPESKMEYGREATQQLINLVENRPLGILIFDQDQYGRHVADLICDGNFVQEHLLKTGCAWHYKTYDTRTRLAQWEFEARDNEIGLWAAQNPEAPWIWRRKNPRMDSST